MKNLIEFFIGDWSNDGHGQGESFYVSSNKTKEELREIYFKACSELGVRLDGHDHGKQFPVPCENYEDSEFPIALYDYLKGKGVKMPEFQGDKGDDSYFPYAEDFLGTVLAVIQWGDPTVEFEVLKAETFHFYGYDKKNRHIGYFGYGLFGN